MTEVSTARSRMPSDGMAGLPRRIESLELEAADELAWLAERLASPGRDMQVLIARYRSPALILGRAQATRWDAAQLQQQVGMPVVVRASGGGAVIAGPWLLSVSVVVPADHPLAGAGLYDAYRWLGLQHEDVMARCGLKGVARAPDTLPARRANDPLQGVCFASLSPWEVTHGDRKLCGLAQVRRHKAMALVAGTHVTPPPWDCLAGVFDCPDLGPRMGERAIDMASLGSRVKAEELAQLWVAQMERSPAACAPC